MRVWAPPLLLLVSVLAQRVCADATSYEGTSCVIDGHNGTCTNMNRCFTALTYWQDNSTKPQICGYEDKDPIICCTDCPTKYAELNLSNAVWDASIGVLWKRGIKAWDKCIDYVHTLPYMDKIHVVTKIKKIWLEKSKCDGLQLLSALPAGGEDTQRGEYPFMALLGYGADDNTTQWLCGGALISERFIMTAAHCIASRFGPVKYAALGVWKRDEPEEMWQKHNIEKIIPHPDYRPPSKYHDIALLQTEKPVEFTDGSLPACLHIGDGEAEDEDEDHYALGWGALGYRQPTANILQKVDLKEFSLEECKQLYPAHRHFKRGYDHATQMCYGDKENPRDTCEGDSGGPLLLPISRKPSILKGFIEDQVAYSFTIKGVTSAGLPCGKAGRPGLYTRVSAYRSWIEDIVWG